jgi:regulator of RNase E activity RraB
VSSAPTILLVISTEKTLKTTNFGLSAVGMLEVGQTDSQLDMWGTRFSDRSAGSSDEEKREKESQKGKIERRL